MEDNFVYYRRRATEELAAAERASNAAIAAVHKSMAARYLALSGEPVVAVLQQKIPTEPS